jgi:glutamate:GABA antiporter
MKLVKSLGLWDIVLFNVTAIIGLRWISIAASGGNSTILLWLAAALLFFIPQAFAVITLTARLPGEGGFYLWTKEAFGDFHGFISGWCYWTSNLVYFPNLLVYVAGISVFVAGSGYEAVGEDKVYIILFSLAALWSVTLFNFFGLHIGRWVHNVGGFGSWLTGTMLIIFGIVAIIRFGVANPMPLESFYVGIISLDKLSFFASICFGFAGFELASILAGEVKDPARNIPRAVIISGAIIACIYILGTLAVLVALPSKDINIISGFLQGIAAIGNRLGLGWTSNVIALLITLGGIGGLMAWFTGSARLPFVAGIDHYLPKGFGKVHPRYGSPYVSVFAQSIIATLFIIMSFIGSTVEEAYLILFDTTLLVYFIPYGYIFAAYIVITARDHANRNSPFHGNSIYRTYILGGCGFLTTVFAMAMSLVPPAEAANVWLFEAKIIGGFATFLFTGIGIYWIKSRKSPHIEPQ